MCPKRSVYSACVCDRTALPFSLSLLISPPFHMCSFTTNLSPSLCCWDVKQPTNKQISFLALFLPSYHLIGLVVKVFTSRAEDPRFDSCLHCGGFLQVRSCQRLKIDTPVATLPGSWRCRSALGQAGLVSVYCDWVR